MKLLVLLKREWQRAKDNSPKRIPFKPCEDHMHGLRQLAQYGTEKEKEHALKLLEKEAAK